ncbi:hypothetical protein [Rheinheimera sp.]|uniref:hypothetical protein n=1 Tax=Rheinheimera sp. TaxID=1869214 RepID=UPI0027357C47|nr:hypothetical protein [Rheinheimera sp.]MDP2716493.1 hypothetical protein [Rheinheimera sp.]
MVAATTTRNAMIDWLLTNNTRYHLTVTFTRFTPEPVCVSRLNKLIKQLNRAIYKRRFKQGLSFLKGFAVQEYTTAMQTYHFHILIADDDWLPKHERFEQLLNKQLDYLKRYNSQYYIAHYLLQDYYNDGTNKLEWYLTKQFEFGGSRSSNRVGWLSDTSIYFGDFE